ncbi:unnamed protein product [Rodentolepis nana]|uniref:RRM domain-containing protein n=1 Tax=Rodentolepis nana TaxID=102285 RepID=A0A0R3T3K6_RODNA|nr:unnamed protein product [Rodentolepis nana]
MTSVIIRLQNLPISANASNIRRFFSGLSIPEGGVHIVGGEKGDAFIAFATDEDARRAMLLDQQSINGTKIRLFLSSKTEMQTVIEMARSSVMKANHQMGHLPKPSSQYNNSHTISAAPQSYPLSSNADKSPYSSTISKGSYSLSSLPTDVPPYGYGYGSSWSNERNDGQDGYSSYGIDNRSETGRRDNSAASLASSKYDDPSTDRHYNLSPSYPPEDGYYGDGNGYDHSKANEPSSQPPGYPNDRGFTDVGRDFSVRPPWLADGNRNQFSKRSVPPDSALREPVPFKRNRSEEFCYPSNREVPCLDFVVKISMRPADVSVKGTFDILRGVNIIPKFGIRVEEDEIGRYTGNVYCLLTCPESHARALSYHKKVVNGYPIEVYNSNAEDFFKVTDSNFASRCPHFIQSRIPNKGTYKPLYYADACIEMSEIPSNVTEEDIVAFLGVPGLSASDVKISQSGVPLSIVALIHLPSVEVLNILLDAPSRRFSANQSRDLRLVAISALQFKYAPPRQPLYAYKPESGNSGSKISTSQKPESKTCCFIYGFSRSITIFDLTQIFPNVFIPGDAIHLLPNGRSAVIDFLSEESCRNALRDFQVAEGDLKKTHRLLSMRAITKLEYDQKIEESQEEPSKQIVPDGRSGDSSFRPPRFRPPFSQPHRLPPFGPRGVGSRPPYPPPPRARFNRPPGGPSHVTNLFLKNLPPNCPPGALLDIFHRFRPLPGSLRFRRDPRGAPTGEAVISFGTFADAEQAARETDSTRLFSKTISVHIQPQ